MRYVLTTILILGLLSPAFAAPQAAPAETLTVDDVNGPEVAHRLRAAAPDLILTYHFDQILKYFHLPVAELSFLNEPPIQRINPLKYVWEARRDAGLDYNPSDPIQALLILQLKNTFNSAPSDPNSTI